MSMHYRLGWPLGKVAARIGIPTLVRIDVIRDQNAGVFVGTSRDVEGLVLEADTLENLMTEAHCTIPALLDCNDALCNEPVTSIRYNDRLAHA